MVKLLINIDITIVYIGIISACLTLFLNYCMGKPGDEFSPYEIFSFYTVWLSKRRLKQVGLYDEYSEQYHDNLKRLESYHASVTLKNDFKKVLYKAADPFFTWERAIGMCPVCFGFWVSLSCAIFFTQNVVNLVSIVVISHATLRILNKIL